MLAIVTESTSGITREEADELGVTIVPTYYVVDGVSRKEEYADECGDYASLFAGDLITHSEPAFPNSYVEAFSEAFAKGYDVLCITISSRLSAGYRSALNAKKFFFGEDQGDEDEPGKRQKSLYVLDSGAAGASLEILVRTARAAADRGLSLEEVVAEVERKREHLHALFAVEDMVDIRRSGRLTNTRRSVSSSLDRYPIFVIQRGGVTTSEVARGTQGMAKLMLRDVPANVRQVYVAYFGVKSKALTRLLGAIGTQHRDARVSIKDGGPVLTCNIGVGAVSLIWDDEDVA